MARNAVDDLNHLIEINKDAEAGFRTAVANVKNTELETLFGGYAIKHLRFIAELQEEIKRLGGKYTESGTVGGALHRGWMDLKSAVSGHSAAAMLASCQSGEESAAAAYEDAFDANPTGQTHTLLQRHRQQIEEFCTRLTRLVKETNNGLEFPANEEQS